MDYISTKAAAVKFGISDRRVQKLCESGRIPGAQMISGVWLIPESAQKPADERYAQISIFDLEDKGLSLSDLCKDLSISLATGKNWIKLGKIVPTSLEGKTPYFSEEYVNKIKAELTNGENTALKSRRNKKYVSGNELYKDYVSSDSKAISTVQEILSFISENEIQLTDNVVSYLLAECASQLIGQRFLGQTIHLSDILNKRSVLNDYTKLVYDLISDNNAEEFISNNTRLFQPIYTYENGEDTLGLLYISLNNLGDRKAKGAYYTPTRIVKKLINNLQEFQSFQGKDIIDPCCGTGNFLLQLPSNLSVENIYGSDIDEISIKLTRINIALKYKQRNLDVLYGNFSNRNYLFEDTDTQFDIIIGNPPWGYDFSDYEKEQLKEKYKSAEGKNVESFDVFIEQALKELRKKGTLSFVLPESVLNVKAHTALREILLQQTSIQYLEMLGNAFDKVQCPSIILQLLNTKQALDTRGMVVCDGKRRYTLSLLRDITSEYFSFLTTDEEYSIIKKMDSVENKTTIKDNGIFALGIVTGNNKEYITNTQDDHNEMVLKGSDIYKYRFQPAENYIRFTPDAFQQVAPTEYYRAPEKLLYRFICNQLVFAYDNKQTLSLNSCNILIPEIEGLDIKYILAVLNSRCTQFYFRKQFNSVKILRSHIEALPIPKICMEKQNEIIATVDSIISSNNSNEILHLYNELDKEIANLFCINSKEYSMIMDSMDTDNLFLYP